MKDFENLTPEEQTNVIMQIGSKLTGQEVWYWEGIVHKLREYKRLFDDDMEIRAKLLAKIDRLNYDLEQQNIEAGLEIERLKNKVKEINKEMNYQINLKTKNANEINRLNNIINKLEEWLEDYHNNTGLGEYETGIDDGICDTLKKLQELKGDSSNE